LFKGFRTFGRNNNNPSLGNNNNNNLLSLLSLSVFGGGLEGGFNSSPGGNLKGLDPNITVLVNILAEINLGINYIKRELNHIKLTEFEEIEAEDLNK